jgi:high affinity sulfate transporter 1
VQEAPRAEAAGKTRRGLGRVAEHVPGLVLLHSYRPEWLPRDLLAGLSVAAIAVPVGIAYAQLAGLPPVTGLYASVLPPVAYAFFGSSRQLIVGPDAATATMAAAVVAPLALGSAERYAPLSFALALLTGLLGIAGGFARLGFITTFLSRPILSGYLNGIALSIISGQLGALFGFRLHAAGFFRRLYEFFSGLGQTHWPTLVVGAVLLAIIWGLKRIAPSVPGPLVAVVLGIVAVLLFGLGRRGVAVAGPVPAGLPHLALPRVTAQDLGALSLGSLGLLVVSFTSAMLTNTSFAARRRYRIDANQDFLALGVANLASGISGGFAISGADSRTAISDSVGGKTQVTSLVAAAAIAAVLLFLTGPLAFTPMAALAAVLISAGIGLFDTGTLRRVYRVSREEFGQSLVATLGVITIGVLPGIAVAVGLALLNLIRRASRPNDALLGRVEGAAHFAPLEEGAVVVPGLVIYRYESALVFFNADHFKDRVRAAVAQAPQPVVGFVLDAEGMNAVDVTGLLAIEEVRAELAGRGVAFAVARAKGWFRNMLDRSGMTERIGPDNLFPSVAEAVRALQRLHPGEQPPAEEEAA